MSALNIAGNVVGTAGSASGGASASSGQGGAGLGFNILGAPGDPAGVLTNLLTNRKIRKEDKRRFDANYGLQAPLIKAQTQQLNLENQKAKEDLDWRTGLRKIMVRGAY